MPNALKNLAKKTKKTKGTSKEKPRYAVKNEGSFFEMVEALKELKTRKKDVESELGIIQEQIKSIADDAFIELYEEMGKNPGTFMMEEKVGSKLAQVMMSMTDKYTQIDEERAVELINKYGEDIVTDKTEYSISPKMVEKYSDEIAEFIQTSDKIADEDRESILTMTEKFSISKGSINKLKEYLQSANTDKDSGEIFEGVEEDESNVVTLKEVFDDLGVVKSLKSPQINE